jgi:hypothetical protein
VGVDRERERREREREREMELMRKLENLFQKIDRNDGNQSN